MTEENTNDPLIKIKRENYVSARTASGGKSLHNNDSVARGLQGLNLDELYGIAASFLAFPIKIKGNEVEDAEQLQAVYSSLNVGMQRMNLGNRIRARVTKIDMENDKAAAKAEADGKTPKATKSGAEQLDKILSPYAKARDAREKEAAKAAEEKAKAAAEAKANAA